MTHEKFIELNDGKFIEVAGSANALNQCTDLANAYLRDVLNHPIVEWTNAIDFPEKLTDFKWIENTPAGIPQQGDLMIFFGYYGHISIFDEGNVNLFRSFDQNYPANSPAHIQQHNYSNVFGWLRPPESNNMSDEARLSRDHYWNILKKIAIILETKIEKESDVDKLPTMTNDLQREIIELEEHECPIITKPEPSGKLKLLTKRVEYVKGKKKIVENYG